MWDKLKNIKPELALYFGVIAIVAFGYGMSDSVLANYFKDAYAVTAIERGFIEFPRELPGVLCALVVAILAAFGDVRAAIIAQGLCVLGLSALGLFTPVFGVMLVFLFLFSMGQHLFMPLQDSIGMSLAEPDKLGKRMGQYASVRSGVGFVAALLIFFGFRFEFFSFTTPIKLSFLIGVGAFVLAVVGLIFLSKRMSGRIGLQPGERKKIKFVFRKEYKYYYMLTVLNGVQKQIAFVYGTWVVVDLLMKKADTTAILAIVSSFICIFFMNFLGKWMDKFGLKKMMYLDALTFIGVYVLYGFTVWGITAKILPDFGWPVILVYVLFIADRLSMQIGMVKSIYLRSIAIEESDVTATLSLGISMDHVVSIIAAALGGLIWTYWGSQWVFFMAAIFSLGNLIVAGLVNPDKEIAHARAQRQKRGIDA